MKHNKLVRNKVPENLAGKNIGTRICFADDTEYWQRLKDKLREEVDEYIATEDNKEFADILEVMDAMFEYLGLSKKYIRFLQDKKAKKNGRFRDKIILLETYE